MGPFHDRFTLTIFGIVFLLVGVFALINGDRQQASMQFIIGGAVVVGNEWWEWRKRQ